MEYVASVADKQLEIINLERLEAEAEKVLPKGAFGYISGGAGDEWTMRRNKAAFDTVGIVPRVLAGLEQPDLRTSQFGTDLPFPVIMAPVAAQGLCHLEGEKATARALAGLGSIMCLSTYANTSIEDAAGACGGSAFWFQIYMSKKDDFNYYLLDKAVECGARAIVLTADATVGGNREDDVINKFVFPLGMPNLTSFGDAQGHGINEIFASALQKIQPSDVAKIATRTKLPVIVKGVLCPEDAVLAMDAGAAGIWVSTHGGRQLDGGPGSFDVLKTIAGVVRGRVPIIFDSGIRRGQHAFKALACGADLVALGRPVLYGLALGGTKGVISVFKHLEMELTMVMQLAGTKTVADIRKAMIMPISPAC